jgi:hypothetical protein
MDALTRHPVAYCFPRAAYCQAELVMAISGLPIKRCRTSIV